MNTELENQIYQRLNSLLGEIIAQHGDPQQVKWRGMGTVYCLKGFLDTALQSQDHGVMKTLDHMFIEMVDIYKSGADIDEEDIKSEAEKLGIELGERMEHQLNMEDRPAQVDEDEDVDDKVPNSSPDSSVPSSS